MQLAPFLRKKKNSEVLTELLDCKFRQNVSLSPENCLKYIRRKRIAQDEVAFSIHTAISIYVVGSKPQPYKTRPKGNMGS